jgi:single-strand DNA-binding protein
MSDMNRVILMGHLGNAPELRLNDGHTVLKMRLATNESWLDKNKNERQERVEWHDVTVFGNRAESLSRLLGKGDCIGVEGSLRTSSWEKDGVKRWRTEVVALNVFLTGKRAARAAVPAVNADLGSDAPPPSFRRAPQAEVVEADVPF